MLQRSRSSLTVFAALASLTLLAAACDSAQPSDGAASGPPVFAPAEGASAPAPAEEAKIYEVTPTVVRGEDGTVSLVAQVVGLNGYHINVEENFPWGLTVADDAPLAAGTVLTRADATVMEEERAVFSVTAPTPSEDCHVEAEVRLGVCDDEGCVMIREQIAWAVAP